MQEPKIRFKGFEGEWETTIVRDICSVINGKSNTQDQTSNGKYPFFIRSEKVMKSNRYLYDGEAVITIGDGQIGKVFHYINGKFDLHQRCYMMYNFHNIIGRFFFYFFSTSFYSRVIKMSAKATVDSVRMNMITDMPIYYPNNICEQRAIASYFQHLDALIQSTTKKIESLKQVKAASLQSMFPQEGETTPRVRFKGFEGEWKKVKLSDCLEISNERNLNNTFGINEVLSVSDEEGVMNQIKLLGRSYAGRSVTNYKVLRTNQVVYTKSPLKAKPYGIVKVNKGDVGIVSVLYAVYNAKEGVCPDYIHYYFEPTFRINNYLQPLINKGAKNTMNISDETSLQGNIVIPKTIDEQCKIVEYFQSLDRQITLQSQRLEKLKQIKAACLDNMFV